MVQERALRFGTERRLSGVQARTAAGLLLATLACLTTRDGCVRAPQPRAILPRVLDSGSVPGNGGGQGHLDIRVNESVVALKHRPLA